MKNIIPAFIAMIWLGIGLGLVSIAHQAERTYECENSWWVDPILIVMAPAFVTGYITADALGWESQGNGGCINSEQDDEARTFLDRNTPEKRK